MPNRTCDNVIVARLAQQCADNETNQLRVAALDGCIAVRQLSTFLRSCATVRVCDSSDCSKAVKSEPCDGQVVAAMVSHVKVAGVQESGCWALLGLTSRYVTKRACVIDLGAGRLLIHQCAAPLTQCAADDCRPAQR